MSASRTMNGAGFLAAALLALLFTSASGVRAEEKKAAVSGEWPQWRGPTHDGIVPNAAKIIDTIPKDGLRLLWKSGTIPATWNSGGGGGCPTVAEGKVFIYAAWRRPADGSDKYVPFTAQVMSEWGYIADMPEDLAKKIEEARLKTPKFNAGYHLVDYWMPEKQQDEGAEKIIKMNEELDKYLKDFLATLDPKDAGKYGAYVKRRFCNRDTGCGGPLTWEQAKKASAGLLNKESSTFKLGVGVTEEKFNFDIPLNAAAGAWDRVCKTTDTLICLDAATGKELWKKEFPTAKNWGSEDGLNGILGPASTPAYWSGKFYAAGVGGLYCVSAKDGTLLWQVKHGGSHASVLVADGVVVYPGANTAYDAETGKELWSGGGCGNSSPVLWISGDKKFVIAGGTCCDLHTGKVAWKVNLPIGYGLTPLVSGDILIGCGQAFKMTPEKAELLWKIKGNFDPATSPIVYQDYLYDFSSWYGGDGWHCYDMKTGEEKWKQPDPKASLAGDCTCSSPILIDGKIIHPIGQSHSGHPFQVEMLQASPEKYTPLGSFDPKMCPMSSPSFEGGRLYLRLMDGVACYDLTGTAK